jgi:hypothetical protein
MFAEMPLDNRAVDKFAAARRLLWLSQLETVTTDECDLIFRRD